MIPKNLDECFKVLDGMISPEDRFKFRENLEKDVSNLHFNLGMKLRNNWGLWTDSELKNWFKNIGIHHPDDMSGIILTSYWRYLNDEPIRLEEQVNFYTSYWASIKIQFTN